MSQEVPRNQSNDKEFETFINAIKSCDNEQIDNLLARFGKDFVNRIELQLRQPPLYFATLAIGDEASAKVIQKLIQHGAVATTKDQHQQTVLFYACREGKMQCAQALIRHGCKLEDEDVYGQTPIFYAANENRLHLLPLFNHPNLFHHTDKLANQTPLFYSARKGHLEMTKILVDKGCNAAHLDAQNKTAADYAKKGKFHSVFEFLNGELKKIKNLNLMIKAQPQSSQQINESGHNDRKKKKGNNSEVPVARLTYKIVHMNDKGQLHDLTQEEVKNLSKDNPELQKYLSNPEIIPVQELDMQGETWEKIAAKMIGLCWKLKGSYWFHEPVDPVKYNIMDYYDIVEKPIDMGTIKKKLQHNVYPNANSFVADMKLIWTNCFRYNGYEHEISRSAKQLQTVFTEYTVSQGLSKYLTEMND